MFLGIGVFFIIFFHQAVQAGELTPGQKDDILYISQEQEDMIDAAQAKASGHLISAATWFDSFFDDHRYV